MRIAIFGLGLIGGSIARALRRPGALPGAWQIAAVGRRRERLGTALREGVVDAVATDLADGIAGADLVVLAASATVNLALIDALAAALGASSATTTVTDVSSTKGAICARAERHPGLRFVGGHPMSGRERSGYAAAEAGLFAGRPWVIVPGLASSEDVERVEVLARACGATPVHLGAAEHDAAVAAISHLPLVAAAALVEAVAGGADWPLARSLAAQGWRDATRLARGDPAMGAALVATNREALAGRLRRYRAELDRWLTDVEEADEAAIADRLRLARGLTEAGA